MTRKASAARMSILILIAEPQLSSPVRGMTRSRAMQKKQAQKNARTKADTTNSGELNDNSLIVSGLLCKFICNIGNDIHNFRNEGAILGNRHDAHVIALDNKERHRIDRSTTARRRRIALALMAAKAKAYGNATHRHHSRITGLNRFTNDSFRLRDEAEFF